MAGQCTAEVFVADAGGDLFDQIDRVEQVGAPARHLEDVFLLADRGFSHPFGGSRAVGDGPCLDESTAHTGDGGLDLEFAEFAAEDLLEQPLGQGHPSRLAVRASEYLLIAIGDLDCFHGSAPGCESQADEQKAGFACAFVPAGDVDEEIRCRFGHRGVVTIDDGWKGEHTVKRIEDDGESSESFEQVGIVHTFGVMFENLLDTHVLLHRERNEGVGFGHGHDSEWGNERVQVMDADRGASSSSSEAEVEFLLMIHQRLDEGIVLFRCRAVVNTAHDCAEDDGSDVFEGWVDGHRDVAIASGEVWLSAFLVQEGTSGVGHGFGGEQVGAVGKDLDLNLLRIILLDHAADVGQLRRPLPGVVFDAVPFLDGGEGFVVEGHCWHANPSLAQPLGQRAIITCETQPALRGHIVFECAQVPSVEFVQRIEPEVGESAAKNCGEFLQPGLDRLRASLLCARLIVPAEGIGTNHATAGCGRDQCIIRAHLPWQVEDVECVRDIRVACGQSDARQGRGRGHTRARRESDEDTIDRLVVHHPVQISDAVDPAGDEHGFALSEMHSESGEQGGDLAVVQRRQVVQIEHES